MSNGVRAVLAGILTAGAALAQQSPAAPPPQSSAYAGSAVCKTCHPNVWGSFFRNPHAQLNVPGRNLESPCEACHGPGQAHVTARGGKATIPNAFSSMPPQRILDTCLECHSRDINRAAIRRSEHSLHDVVCTGCHSVHRSATPKYLLADVQRELCYGCHAQVRAQFSMPFKHRVNEGFMQCSDCHNPHGTPAPAWRMGLRPRMVDQALSNEQPCLRCHTDKRGPFVFEHAALRVDGCESCHQPHGSANARLLRRPVVFTLCLECHNGASGFGRTGNGIPTQAPFHDMSQPRWQNCTTCHVRIHGSNAHRAFLR